MVTRSMRELGSNPNLPFYFFRRKEIEMEIIIVGIISLVIGILIGRESYIPKGKLLIDTSHRTFRFVFNNEPIALHRNRKICFLVESSVLIDDRDLQEN